MEVCLIELHKGASRYDISSKERILEALRVTVLVLALLFFVFFLLMFFMLGRITKGHCKTIIKAIGFAEIVNLCPLRSKPLFA